MGEKGSDARVGAKPSFTRDQKQATLDDRKRQLNQLAAMGVAVPDQMRGDMALAGEWTVVSEKVIGEDGKEVKLNEGVRKRKLDEEEREQLEAAEMITKHKGWGRTFKSFPGKLGGGDEDDVEALFGNVGKKVKKEEQPVVKAEPEVKDEAETKALQDIPTEEKASAIKPDLDVPVKEEEEAPAPAVVFKKRKKIAR